MTAKEQFEALDVQERDIDFTPADVTALERDWSWVMGVVQPAVEAGPAAQTDDDLAYVSAWVRGGAGEGSGARRARRARTDAAAVTWALAGRAREAGEVWVREEEGHVSLLRAAEDALARLAARLMETRGEDDHVIAHTLPRPNASTSVLVTLGFEHVDDHEDPEVGTVWEWR